mgnify:CR=1 FL=1
MKNNMYKAFVGLLAMIATMCTVVISCGTEQTIVPDPEPIEIQIPEPCRYGFIMIRTPEGNQTMYSSSIDIQNDGRDGKAIYIVLDKGVMQQ